MEILLTFFKVIFVALLCLPVIYIAIILIMKLIDEVTKSKKE